jgi:hypothetical protein
VFYVIRRTVKGTNPIVMTEHDTLEDAQRHAKVQRGTQSHVWRVETVKPEGATDRTESCLNTYLIPERDSLAYFLTSEEDRAGWTETTIL